LGTDDASPGGTNSSDKSVELKIVPQKQNSDVLMSIRGGYFNWIEEEELKARTAPGRIDPKADGSAPPAAHSKADFLSVGIREDAPTLRKDKDENAADSPKDKLARCTLKNVDLTINRGDLVAVVGSVGAGCVSFNLSCCCLMLSWILHDVVLISLSCDMFP
jgi:hypothetical protein